MSNAIAPSGKRLVNIFKKRCSNTHADIYIDRQTREDAIETSIHQHFYARMALVFLPITVVDDLG